MAKNMIPLDGLDKHNRDIIRAVAQANNAPTDFAWAGMMAATATMLGKKITCTGIQPYKNHGSLWLAVVGLPSDSKSETTAFFMSPIQHMDEQSRQRYMAEMAYWNARSKAKGGTDEPQPVFHVRAVSDISDEALIQALATNDGICWYNDELASMFGQMGRYTKTGDASGITSRMLEIFSYKPISVLRKSQDPIGAERPCLSILGTIQSGTFKKIMDGKMDNGFFHRFLYVFPDVERKRGYQRPEPLGDARQRWEDELRRIDALPAHDITVTPEAVAEYEAYKDELCGIVYDTETTDQTWASIVAKYGYHVCRVAIVAAVLARKTCIDGGTMRYAVEVCRELMRQGEKAYRLVRPDEERPAEPKRMAQAELLKEVLSRFGGGAGFTPKELAKCLGVSEQMMWKYYRETKR